MKNTLLTFMLLIILSSCERVATVEIPATDPMPVMYSFLSPETSVSTATITMTAPIYGNSSSGNFETIRTADVTISDNNGASAKMIFDANINSYFVNQSDFPINPGMTYTLVAKFDNYSLQASTTVPSLVIYLDEAIGEKLPPDPNGLDRYMIRMKWKDAPGVTNYYRVNLEELNSFNPGDSNAFSIGDKMFSDNNKDGETMSDKFEYYDYGFAGNTPAFNAYLVNTDIHYYEYHRRRLNYFGDDPFSEPLQQYSNVKGGLGAVCSFRKTMLRVNL